MFKIKVTMTKEVGVAKKLVLDYPDVVDYGWMEQPIFFIQTTKSYVYFNAYEIQWVEVQEYELKEVTLN